MQRDSVLALMAQFTDEQLNAFVMTGVIASATAAEAKAIRSATGPGFIFGRLFRTTSSPQVIRVLGFALALAARISFRAWDMVTAAAVIRTGGHTASDAWLEAMNTMRDTIMENVALKAGKAFGGSGVSGMTSALAAGAAKAFKDAAAVVGKQVFDVDALTDIPASLIRKFAKSFVNVWTEASPWTVLNATLTNAIAVELHCTPADAARYISDAIARMDEMGGDAGAIRSSFRSAGGNGDMALFWYTLAEVIRQGYHASEITYPAGSTTREEYEVGGPASLSLLGTGLELGGPIFDDDFSPSALVSLQGGDEELGGWFGDLFNRNKAVTKGIKGIADTGLLGLIPGVGGYLQSGATMIGTVGDYYAKREDSGQLKSAPPVAFQAPTRYASAASQLDAADEGAPPPARRRMVSAAPTADEALAATGTFGRGAARPGYSMADIFALLKNA